MKIWFDMDGTLADLYNVNGWLAMLQDNETTPYEVANEIVNMKRLEDIIEALQMMGHYVGVISWGSKNADIEYLERIARAKIEWLRLHMPHTHWNAIHIVSYGTPKRSIGIDGILFDDDARIRNAWGEGAYTENQIFDILTEIVKEM